eukprot:gene31533-6718_t
MQSNVSFASRQASRCRVPAAARCSVLRSLIPTSQPQGPSTKCWSKLIRAVEESKGSGGDTVTDEAVFREVTRASNAEESNHQEADGLNPHPKNHQEADGLNPHPKKHEEADGSNPHLKEMPGCAGLRLG